MAGLLGITQVGEVGKFSLQPRTSLISYLVNAVGERLEHGRQQTKKDRALTLYKDNMYNDNCTMQQSALICLQPQCVIV
eukprot:6459069-Amphidinium_carterae.3